MEEGEKSPLLSQDAGGQEPPLPASCLGPELQEGPAWRAGLGGGRAPTLPSLPLRSSCLQCLIFLSNFLFSLLGLLALAIGLWGLAVKGSLGSSWGDPLPADPMLGLVLGGLAVSAVSLAGCLGALCENACLLRCFSGGLLAFLVLEALAGALVVALWGPLQHGLERALHVAITHYQDDPDLRFLMDQVQLGLQCCGAASYQDWQQNLYFNCSAPGIQACSLPASCCLDPREDGASVNEQCGFGALGLEEDAARGLVHVQGCGAPLRRWLRGTVRAAGGLAIAAALVQGAELLVAAHLLRVLAGRKVAPGPSPRQCPLTGAVDAPRTSAPRSPSPLPRCPPPPDSFLRGFCPWDHPQAVPRPVTCSGRSTAWPPRKVPTRPPTPGVGAE